MRISDWSSDVCSSDLIGSSHSRSTHRALVSRSDSAVAVVVHVRPDSSDSPSLHWSARPNSASALRSSSRSEEHTSELQSLMRSSDDVFCLKKKKKKK